VDFIVILFLFFLLSSNIP